MENMNQSMIELVAQTTPPANGAGQPGGGAGKSAGGVPNIFFGLMLAMVVFYIFLFRGQGRKKKELAKMIQGLKKNDRVVTIGGIVGTVVTAKEDEIVVRVDESNNTKMTFVRQSIQRVINGDTDDKSR
ncbi:MAG: preprotein translocase subunit YajC [Planctomycetes bacterium]|nr:preprotein translocase subunit YajC [Planctomycetota bacterium]